MMKNIKIFILGAPGVGKTSLLHQVLFGTHLNGLERRVFPPTIEDVYFATLDGPMHQGHGDRNSVIRDDRILLFDVAGVKPNIDIELLRNYISYADEFILVYSINDLPTFNLVDTIKKLIDQSKGKRDHPTIALGNKVDLDSERQVNFDEALVWAKRENVKLFEVTSHERGTLYDFARFLSSQLTPTQSHSTSGFKLRRSKTNQSIPGPGG